MAKHRRVAAVAVVAAALLALAVYCWRQVSWTVAGRTVFAGAYYIYYIDGDDVILLASADALRALDRSRGAFLWMQPELGSVHRIVGIPGTGSALLQNGASSFVRLDMRTGETLSRLSLGGHGSFYSIPSPDGASALVGDGIISLGARGGDQLLQGVPDHYYDASPGAFSSDGTLAVMEAQRENEKVLLLLEPGSSTPLRTIGLEHSATSPLLAVHESAGVILAASTSAVKGYALDSGEQLWATPAPSCGVLAWAVVSERPIALAGTRGGSLIGIDCETGNVMFTRVIDERKAIWQVEISPSGDEVAISAIPAHSDPLTVLPRDEYVQLYRLADLLNDEGE